MTAPAAAAAATATSPSHKVAFARDARPGNRNDTIAARAALTIPAATIALTDAGYWPVPGATLPPKHPPARLTAHKRIRAETEHVLARLKNWQILWHCRRRGNSTNLPSARSHICGTRNSAPAAKLSTSSTGCIGIRINS